jgi:DNA-binding MarR family transcriptional regulator
LADGTQLEILRQNSSTREDLGLLAVMDALEKRDRITQRELARVTGLTLKKVNYCLHKLLQKGHVKFQRARNNPDKRIYLYILTPSGMRAKSRLTYRFVRFTLDFYGQVEQKLLRCLREMDAAGATRILLYGATDAARILLDLAQQNGVEVVGVVDDDYDGMDFHGVPAFPSRHLREHTWDGILVTTLQGPDEATGLLRGRGVPPDSIWELS